MCIAWNGGRGGEGGVNKSKWTPREIRALETRQHDDDEKNREKRKNFAARPPGTHLFPPLERLPVRRHDLEPPRLHREHGVTVVARADEHGARADAARLHGVRERAALLVLEHGEDGIRGERAAQEGPLRGRLGHERARAHPVTGTTTRVAEEHAPTPLRGEQDGDGAVARDAG